MKRLLLLLLLPLWFASCDGKDNIEPVDPQEATIDWKAAADSSSRALTQQFWDGTDHYFWTDNHGNKSFQYWPNAHALDVVTDAYLRSNSDYYKAFFSQWFEGVRKKNGNRWYNNFFDDMEWNGIALVRVYSATNEQKYLDAAKEIWGYIIEGWNDYAGGGIAWERDNNIWSKNACSNGPASILAARLYAATGENEYQEWAKKIYDWEKAHLFNSGTGAVYDSENGKTGEVNKSWVFTYNEGTFIGAAVELHKITGEKAYLNDAVLAANYTTTILVNNSLLKDEGTGDGGLFKGIFIRYFTDLIGQERLSNTDRTRYKQFLKYNAETLWTKGTYKPAVAFGPYWGTAPQTGNAGLTEQLSGCMLMEAAATCL
jgi:predicted alpha-1,6-mannanase (GH76 family)